jgi:hypothetical protein
LSDHTIACAEFKYETIFSLSLIGAELWFFKKYFWIEYKLLIGMWITIELTKEISPKICVVMNSTQRFWFWFNIRVYRLELGPEMAWRLDFSKTNISTTTGHNVLSFFVKKSIFSSSAYSKTNEIKNLQKWSYHVIVMAAIIETFPE